MARITLSGVRHTYQARPRGEDDWAVRRMAMEWSDGGAYALLGPSGCGKTTLLNIMSGLVRPTEGRVLFDGADLTDTPTERRRIAQVFQFPVVYDTMTVRQNLAFPLRNRGLGRADVDRVVGEIARMLDLEGILDRPASRLTADGKQKISLGRGLVRADVNAILLDEPLPGIDPHLKSELRAKLKELHQRTGRTMVYVTHDQIEALTFAERVVVMHAGEVVQIGSPVELFERPRHTFVGHFIGSPGMNVLPCAVEDGVVRIAGHPVKVAHLPATPPTGRLEVGVRPEFVSLSDEGLPVAITRVSDVGRHLIVDARLGDHRLKLLTRGDVPVAVGPAHVELQPGYTRLYADGWVVE